MNQDNIIISNPEEFEKKKKEFISGGVGKLHVLSDFDKTLTRATYSGNRAGSVISHLRNGKYLSEDYAERAHELFDKYHPIEIDPNIKWREKNEKMDKWWRAHKELLIESGFNKGIVVSCVKEMIDEKYPEFRGGVVGFLKSLDENKIPLIVMTASLGDLVSEFMEQNSALSNNVHVIGNKFEYDENGEAVSFKKIIHVLNKHEMEIKDLEIYSELVDKRNVLLLGDNVGDVKMVEGFEYDNLIKVGFLNENVEKSVDDFKRNYDVVIIGDGDFEFVNGLLGEMNGKV
jgi:5'-nucleotidase